VPEPSGSEPGPFTVEHFREWASRCELDNGEAWVLEDFQASFVTDLFSGVPECWLVVPEGNGKTTLAAGLALYHAQFRKTAWISVAAAASDQALILYRQAEGMVQRSDYLARYFRCLEGSRRINCEGTYSRIQVLSAEDRTGDGVIPTLCIVDELHRHRDLRLYRTWRGKLAKRKGQIVAISTAGEPGSEFENTRAQIRQQSEDVERGETFLRARSEHLALHEWAVPEDGDVEDIALVKRANPFSGVTEEILTEKLGSPTMILAHWRRFNCNVATRSDRAAITETEWAAAKTDEQIPAGVPVWVGLDVAWKLDTTAIVPLWWKGETERIFGPATVLVPPRDGTSLDYHRIEEAFKELHKRNPVHTVVMDPTRAEQLGGWLEETLGCRVVDRGATNTAAQLDFERFMEALRLGYLRHQGDAGLTSHALNAIAQLLPTGGARFVRPVTSQRRSTSMQDQRVIDALIAAAMVHCIAASEATGEERVPLIAFI
jgi:phage terminase large subunit-like protein